MTRFEFTKMHGLGNDFVIVDGRAGRPPSVAQIRAMSDRRRGIGCDQ
ncbi:MAG: diaminopimelate epimerase, partial [Pseudomonadota bacterium]|nr:diaminopimelate epimerase [Pseudomonadota bacterium]